MFNRDIIYKGEGESKEFYDVLPRDLTLRIPEYYHQSFRGYTHNTVFREVEINEYQHAPETVTFLTETHRRTKDIEKIYNVLKDVIEREWDPTKTHVIGHSSGYDSRVISNIIKELGEKHGDAWLGEVIYIETLGEREGFRQIMKEQGLKGIVYNDGVPPERHHDYSFNF